MLVFVHSKNVPFSWWVTLIVVGCCRFSGMNTLLYDMRDVLCRMKTEQGFTCLSCLSVRCQTSCHAYYNTSVDLHNYHFLCGPIFIFSQYFLKMISIFFIDKRSETYRRDIRYINMWVITNLHHHKENTYNLQIRQFIIYI